MEFSKSLINKEINIQNILLDELVLNIKEEKDGFDIENILKKDDKKVDKKDSSNSIVFLLSQINLSNSSINITNIENYTIHLKELNFDIKNFGNSKNISSTNSLTFKINDESNVQINSSSKLEPFEINGKIALKNLKIDNALYLDGSISSLYSSQTKRHDKTFNLGPIVGEVSRKDCP
jgi:hypothetical protein